MASIMVWLAGCEKTLNLELDKQPAKLVVEARIENNLPPIVSLSSSLDYFSVIDTTLLSSSFVHGAMVTIQDGNRNYVLQEYAQILPQGNRIYYYGLKPSDHMVGIPGSKYGLVIETGGQTYTASTTIPLLTKKIDSLWWLKAPSNPDTTKVVLMSRVTDPPGFGNYIRYFTRINQEPFLPGYNSVYDDQIIDGKTYDVQIDRGTDKNEIVKREERSYFKRGDTVTVKFCNIDKASYEFWRTWEFNFQSVGNPFSSPGKVLGNISNGGLGAFYGYSAQFKTLVIPK